MAAATAPMPPLGRARPACSLRGTGQTVEKKQQRIGRARAEMRAEHRIEGDDALQAVILQFVIEHVGDIDQHEAQEFAHVVAAEAPDLEAEAGQASSFLAGSPLPRRGGVMSLKGRSTAAKRISFCAQFAPRGAVRHLIDLAASVSP